MHRAALLPALAALTVPLWLGTTAAQAAPVVVQAITSGSPTQSYFGAAPEPWATVALDAGGSTWSLDLGVAKQVRYGWTTNYTGPTGGCCTAQTRSFAFDLSISGVTQHLDIDIQAMQVNNGQFQFDTLDRADAFFDLGALGSLRLDFVASANQMLANLGGGVALFAMATLTAPVQGVPAPGSLWLAGLGLALMTLPRQRQGLACGPGR
jgi:hypothetical protein